MIEGMLYALPTTGSYAIGNEDGPDIVSAQVVEVFLGGQWIRGHVKHSREQSHQVEEPRSSATPQHRGAYHLASNAAPDPVIEASKESFPASDPPAWIDERGTEPRPNENISDGYYFVADSDGSICGLCIGMRVRVP